MRVKRAEIYAFFIFVIVTSFAYPVAFEEKEPRDEKMVLVPKGARPVLKEEYPRGQLVVDRIKARHRYALSIPFSRSWNTAALTCLTGVEEEPQIWNNYEIGFALHSQRLRVGSLKNKEYFQKETAGFPEGRYWPIPPLEEVSQSKGYMQTTFVHLSVKQIRNEYIGYQDFADRISGNLNVIMGKNRNLNLWLQRDMRDFSAEDVDCQPRIRNIAHISYKSPGEGVKKLELYGDSIWSTMTDSAGRDLQYLSGLGSVVWGKSLSSGLDVDLKAKLQISRLRDRTSAKNAYTLETRKTGWLEVSNIAKPASFAKLRLNAGALYDSKHKGHVNPTIELEIAPKILRLVAGLRRTCILPDYDRLYWPSKFVKVNDALKAEDFWESYGLLSIDVITRLKLLAEISYSRPESRITWRQLPNYVWEPANIETSSALVGETSLELNLIRSFNIFASLRHQRFDNQLFDPEYSANAGISFGNSISGSLTLGACGWDFQPLEDDKPPEYHAFVYLRISKPLLKLINIFIDGRFSLDRADVVFYRGMPQAGRIVSFGANIVFGGLD